MRRLRYDNFSLMRRGLAAANPSAFGAMWVALVLVSIGLLVLSALNHAYVRELRWQLAEYATPVLSAILVPLEPVRDFGKKVSSHFEMAAELERLRAENQKLSNWQWRAQELERKLADLTNASRVVQDPAIKFITTRVVAHSSGAFVRSAMINAGLDQNIRSGYPVVTGDGLVGRVVETGRTSARVLLLTDANSRIPVLVGKKGVRAILSGDNGANPKLTYLPQDDVVAAGDEVATSGVGGFFPRGMVIGTVIGAPGRFKVEPRASLDNIEYMSVLFYENPGIDFSAGETNRAENAFSADAIEPAGKQKEAPRP